MRTFATRKLVLTTEDEHAIMMIVHQSKKYLTGVVSTAGLISSATPTINQVVVPKTKITFSQKLHFC